MTRRLLLPLVLALTTVALACTSNDSSPTSTPSATSQPEETATPRPPTPDVIGVSPTPVPTPRPLADLPPPPPIDWTACGSFECATFDVPLDYTDLAAGDITLALTRLPAGDPSSRIGSLFLNPGGPGGSAIEFLENAAFAIPTEIKQRFDVVAFDPRGVNLSSPILCADDVQALLGLDPRPITDAEWQAVVDAFDGLVTLCAERAGAALPHYGTINVAHDMDRIRQALGEDQLSYLGFSYGTSIGQVYAHLFPNNFRGMVLDGALDASLSADERNLEQVLAFEAALNRFFEFCRDSACFDVDPQEAVQTLFDRTEEAPIPAPGVDRDLTQGELTWGILSPLYARFLWSGLANAIDDALAGDGSRMLRLVDSLWARNADGSYDNFFESNIAVNCIDQDVNTDTDHHRMLSEQFAEQAPTFGSWGGYINLPCALWPASPIPPPVPTAAGAGPILVIGNTGDPATPLKWAVALSSQLESATLLTYDAEGHTAFLQGNGCVDGIVTAYFLDLTLPAEGTVCGNAGIVPVPPLP